MCVWGGGGVAQEQLQNKQKLENTTNNNLVRNNEKKIMTPKSAKYEIKKKASKVDTTYMYLYA